MLSHSFSSIKLRFKPKIPAKVKDTHKIPGAITMTTLGAGSKTKLKITLMFRGREMSRIDLGKIVMERVLEELSDVAEIEKDIPLEGRRMSIILNAK